LALLEEGKIKADVAVKVWQWCKRFFEEVSQEVSQEVSHYHP